MQQLFLYLAAAAVGLVALAWGADRLVDGAAATARNLGVAPLIIGLTIVGFGTSAPEILISVMAALAGTPSLAVGNAIGSNIANIALVLGITALISPLKIHSRALRLELPVLMAISLGVGVFLADGTLGFIDGVFLLGGMVVLLIGITWLATRNETDPMVLEFEKELRLELPMSKAITQSLIGLIVLLLSSRLLVWGAVNIAIWFDISDLIIGLTIVALGTSLPELAAAITGALKKEDDIAIGNIIGSNMFNSLAVLGIPGLIQPGPFDPAAFYRDYPVMLLLTGGLFLMAFGVRGPGGITRLGGAILAISYIGYQLLLYFSVRHFTPAVAGA